LALSVKGFFFRLVEVTLMIVSAVIFVAVLFVVGVWCIVLVRGSFKKKAAAIDERDMSFPGRHHLPQMTPQQVLVQARAAARREAAQERAERWQSLTPALVNQAFKNFYGDEEESVFESSIISAAFEEFTKEMKIRH
jgi:hypothetical protein